MNTPQSLFDVGFTAEELDLTANFLSIGEYVDDRSEMVAQMVSSLRLPLLRSLLPSALRNTSVEDIKTVLFHELSCIPKRDVLEILAGGGSYVPFPETVRVMEDTVEMRTLEQPARARSRSRAAKTAEARKSAAAAACAKLPAKPSVKQEKTTSDVTSSEGQGAEGVSFAEATDAERVEALLRQVDGEKGADGGEDGDEDAVLRQLVAAELGSGKSESASELELEEMRARIVWKLTARKNEEQPQGLATVSTTTANGLTAAPESLDMYDDAAVFGDIDAEEPETKPNFPLRRNEDSVPDGFERRKTEGKFFRGRAREELPVSPEEAGGLRFEVLRLADSGAEGPSRRSSAASSSSGHGKETGRRRKEREKKKRKRRRRMKREKRIMTHEEEEEKQQHGPLTKQQQQKMMLQQSAEAEGDRAQAELNPGSEEGELETDDEIELLVLRRKLEQEERAKRLRQLEILKRIAPDEYLCRLREMQEEDDEAAASGDDYDDDPRSVSSAEADASMPWNDPNYGKATRARPSLPKPERAVPRPTNPIEVTNPVAQHPSYQFGLSSPTPTPIQRLTVSDSVFPATVSQPDGADIDVEDDEAVYVKAAQDSLAVFVADLASLESGVFRAVPKDRRQLEGRISELHSDLSDVRKLVELARTKADAQSSFQAEVDAMESRVESEFRALQVLRNYLRGKWEEIGGKENDEEEEGEVDG